MDRNPPADTQKRSHHSARPSAQWPRSNLEPSGFALTAISSSTNARFVDDSDTVIETAINETVGTLRRHPAHCIDNDHLPLPRGFPHKQAVNPPTSGVVTDLIRHWVSDVPPSGTIMNIASDKALAIETTDRQTLEMALCDGSLAPQ